MDSGERAIMAGIHRLQHVQGFAAANLTNDDAVGSHSQGIFDQMSDRDLPRSVGIRRFRLQPNSMNLMEVELGRVLDGYDALTFRNRA